MSLNASRSTFDGETVVMQSDNGMLTLTTERVRFDEHGTGRSRYISIMLDSVSSVGLVTRTYPALLVLAALAFLVFLSSHDDELTAFTIVVALGFLIGYFVTRAAILKISSSGGEVIVVPAKGMDRNVLIGFLNEVEVQRLSCTRRPPS